ncbi:hypothetical protein PPERSA_02578 [Pseudocohnilembus persalinus]|uniref:Insulin-like growth factor binding protein, N-terminal n=1 Tax=Pseudocohnilembus persalinus TaxID=266149 RepID=A0A0V0R5S5_PSEPJ|nr:hypothetical protein PPERSA_02578 [Pseudocohnilembus persalinus]|eukprot:KRX09706.1 hypothetical protein PPERSA_02578 [Pseudocohnilembus persalinus]
MRAKFKQVKLFCKHMERKNPCEVQQDESQYKNQIQTLQICEENDEGICNSHFLNQFKNFKYPDFQQDKDEKNNQFVLNIDQTVENFNQSGKDGEILQDIYEFSQFLQSDYYLTLLILSQNTILLDNSSIYGSNLGVYATNIKFQKSILSSKGLGCKENIGFGCGFAEKFLVQKYSCFGSSGSHASRGLQSKSSSSFYSDICNLQQSQLIYGDKNNPVFEGSGGGLSEVTERDDTGENNGSSGGGVIYMQIAEQVYFGENSGISCEGQSTGVTSKSGAGAGGSLQIHTRKILSQQNAKITVAGGQLQLEEEQNEFLPKNNNDIIQGGGGRIKLNFTTWDYEDISEGLKNLSIDTGNGTIVRTPCLEGYESRNGYTCNLCKAGYFKDTIGTDLCRPCLQQQKNIEFLQSTLQDNQIYQCQYQCVKGYSDVYIDGNLHCLSGYQYMVRQVGGENAFIIIVILVIIALIGLVIGIRQRNKHIEEREYLQQAKLNLAVSKQSKKKGKGKQQLDLKSRYLDIDNQASSDDNSEEEYKEQKKKKMVFEQNKLLEFTVDDLPYHVQRIYLNGKNAFKYPLQLSNDFDKEQLAIHQQDKQLINNFITNMNQISVYPRFQSFLIYVTRFFSHCLWYFLYLNQKKQKITELETYLADFNESSYQKDKKSLKVFKLSVSLDGTNACIDVVNYKKNCLEFNFQSESYFPVVLVVSGSGNFSDPYNIDIKDPFFKKIQFFIENYTEDFDDGFSERSSVQIQNCSSRLDELQKKRELIKNFLDFINGFNVKLKILNMYQDKYHFLKHFDDLTDYLELANEKIFSQLKNNKQDCLEFQFWMHILNPKTGVPMTYMLLSTNRTTTMQHIKNTHLIKNFTQKNLLIKFSISIDWKTKNKIEIFKTKQTSINFHLSKNFPLKSREQDLIVEQQVDNDDKQNQQQNDLILSQNSQKQLGNQNQEDINLAKNQIQNEQQNQIYQSQNTSINQFLMDDVSEKEIKRKIESEIEEPLINYNKLKQQLEQKTCLDKFKRRIWLYISYELLRYRVKRWQKLDQKRLIIIITAFLILELIGTIIIMFHILSFFINMEFKSDVLYQMEFVEIILYFIIFPLSNISAPLILVIWIINTKVKYGKLFIYNNYDNFWNSLVQCIFSIVIQIYMLQFQWVQFIRTINIFIIFALQQLGSIYLVQSQDPNNLKIILSDFDQD